MPALSSSGFPAACAKRSRPLEAGDGLDVFREGHQVEGREAAQAQLAARRQARGVLDERLEAAADVEKELRRLLAQVLEQSRDRAPCAAGLRSRRPHPTRREWPRRPYPARLRLWRGPPHPAQRSRAPCRAANEGPPRSCGFRGRGAAATGRWHRRPHRTRPLARPPAPGRARARRCARRYRGCSGRMRPVDSAPRLRRNRSITLAGPHQLTNSGPRMVFDRSQWELNHRLCSSSPSRSRIRSRHAASGSTVALLATSTTCARCELRSTTTCR